MKHNTRKLAAFLLSVTLSLGSLAGLSIHSAAAASNGEHLASDSLQLYNNGATVPLQDSVSLRASSATAAQRLYNGLSSGSEKIELSDLGLTTDTLRELFQDVVNSHADLFFVSGTYQYSITGNTISALLPSYLSSGTEREKQLAFYNQKMNEIIEGVDPSWTDLEKLLYVHDYLCQHYEYDTSYSNYDAYSFFTQGKGVCQAYTVTYATALRMLGIEASTATSNSMNHIWNIVKLDGKWYHVDVTWDDPISDKFSLANHNFFLLSDAAVQTSRNGSELHHDWISSEKCTSTTYDNAYWMKENVSSPFQCLNGKWYYASFDSASNEGWLNTTTNIAAAGTPAFSLGRWFLHNSSTQFMLNTYCGLDVYNNELYYNTCEGVFRYSEANGSHSVVIPDASQGRLVGLYADGTDLILGMTTDYNVEATKYRFQLDAIPTTPEPTVTPPTITPDTTPTVVPPTESPNNAPTSTPDSNRPSITLNDVTTILKAALNIVTLDDQQFAIADVDGNGSITLSDARIALKLALGIPV